jgi:protein farnesyltransferase/geranylgeranyltransferase type-1 subunit alpha
MSTFSDRPGWEDVVPVPQDDGPNALVKIAYSPSCKCHITPFHLLVLQDRYKSGYVLLTLADQQLMDLFRAILRSGELSERVLDLTEDLLDENAANYTVWLDLPLMN